MILQPLIRFLTAVVLCLAPALSSGGELAPPDAPDGPLSSMATLDDIYNRLTTGAAGDPPSIGYTGPDAGPAPTMPDLSAILDAAPAPDNDFGAEPADVLEGKTFWGLRTDGSWGARTGTAGCTGTALPAQVLEGVFFTSEAGENLAGEMPDHGDTDILPGALDVAIPEGYYSGMGVVLTDPNLTSANIRYDDEHPFTLFGVSGDYTIRDTSGATAGAGDILYGRKGVVNGEVLTGTAEGTLQRSGDAGPGQVMAGKTFSNADAAGLTGTMPDSTLDITPAVNSQTIPAGYHDGTGKVPGDPNLSATNILHPYAIFGVQGDPAVQDTAGATAEAGQIADGKIAYADGNRITGTWKASTFPVPVPATGQATSYTDYDDGYYKNGLSWPGSDRFKDNGNGTVLDNMTGLVWLKNAGCFSAEAWADCLTRCNDLGQGQCGLSDNSIPGEWRLANANELRSLIDYSQVTGVNGKGLPAGHPFTNIQSYYWSSTVNAYLPTTESLYCYLSLGFIFPNGNDHVAYPWPVRDRQEDE